jgi:hydrogenase maturation factor
MSPRAPLRGEPQAALKAGKLPVELLSRLLGTIEIKDPRVLLAGGIGEDAALISFGDRLLIAKSDPVTFASERIGWYNANDVAACGGDPKWFLATILLPEGAAPETAEQIFEQIRLATEAMDVALIGGHTEITVGLPRPIVSGTMLGEVAAGSEITTGGARPGDAILLTGGIAIEGTAILAAEASDALRAAGVEACVLERAAKFLDEPGISVLHAARTIRGPDVTSLHDPTEGGLTGALTEVALASQVGVEIDEAAVAILPETRAVCDALQLNPWGLIASGALLATVREDRADASLARLRDAGVAASRIGRITTLERGRTLRTPDGGTTALPCFERDELARYFESQ